MHRAPLPLAPAGAGRSLTDTAGGARHLLRPAPWLQPGRAPHRYPTYLLDYGAISFSDRALGLEHWVEEVIPTAVDRVWADSGGVLTGRSARETRGRTSTRSSPATTPCAAKSLGGRELPELGRKLP